MSLTWSSAALSDFAFWGGVIPGNAAELRGLADFGVPGAKCFLCPSGVDEFPHVGRADLELAMPRMRDLGLTLLVHAELPAPLAAAEAELAREHADPRRYQTYLRSRPNAAEDEAIAMIIGLSASIAARRTSSTSPAPAPCRSCALRTTRAAGLRRDLPALPDLRRRGDRRRGDGLQVRAAHP